MILLDKALYEDQFAKRFHLELWVRSYKFLKLKGLFYKNAKTISAKMKLNQNRGHVVASYWTVLVNDWNKSQALNLKGNGWLRLKGHVATPHCTISLCGRANLGHRFK